MLTAAAGLLIDGPVSSINYNVEQIIDTLTCMYDQMRIMACRYDADFRTIFDQVGEILKGKSMNLDTIKYMFLKHKDYLISGSRHHEAAFGSISEGGQANDRPSCGASKKTPGRNEGGFK